MRRIVVSQPMYFPWVGIFEQARLAEVFLHYDDVPLPQGRTFIRRVQIKTPNGWQWLTVPVRSGTRLIKDVKIDEGQDWRSRHLRTLRHNYARTSHCDEMLDLVENVFSVKTAFLADLNIQAFERVAKYFDITPHFAPSSSYPSPTRSTDRLVDLVKRLDGDIYVTGHGARNYLDHERFEQQAIQVEYMRYEMKPYPQSHGAFTPYVSILDLIANMGVDGANLIASGTVGWRDFV